MENVLNIFNIEYLLFKIIFIFEIFYYKYKNMFI